MKIRLIIVLLLLSSSQLFAIKLGSGIHYPDGVYLATTLTHYTSKTLTDNHGNTKINNFDYSFSQLLLQPLYYDGNFVYGATIPLVRQKVGSLDSTEYGLGDSFLAVGYFLPVENISILPVLQVKFPVGKFDKDASNNIGNGAYAIQPEIYINKSFSSFMLDGVARYEINFENPDNNIKDGDTLYLEAVIGYKFKPNLIIGPSIFYLQSDNLEINGKKIDDSKVLNLQLGFDVLYTMSSSTAFVLNIMKDVKSRNSVKGLSSNLLVVYSF